MQCRGDLARVEAVPKDGGAAEEEVGLGAEAFEDACQLDGDVPRADHRHALWLVLEVEEPVRGDRELVADRRTAPAFSSATQPEPTSDAANQAEPLSTGGGAGAPRRATGAPPNPAATPWGPQLSHTKQHLPRFLA